MDKKVHECRMESFIKQCSYIKEVKVDFDMSLKHMGIDDIGIISLIILIEKKYNIDMVKHMDIETPLSYTPLELLNIIYSQI